MHFFNKNQKCEKHILHLCYTYRVVLIHKRENFVLFLPPTLLSDAASQETYYFCQIWLGSGYI